jgi:hypothetical protein
LNRVVRASRFAVNTKREPRPLSLRRGLREPSLRASSKGWKAPPGQRAGRARGFKRNPARAIPNGRGLAKPRRRQVPGRKGLQPSILDPLTYTDLTAGQRARAFFILSQTAEQPEKKKPRIGAGLRVSGERRSFFWTRRLKTIPAQGVDVGYAHIAASIRARRSVPFIRLGRVCGI